MSFLPVVLVALALLSGCTLGPKQAVIENQPAPVAVVSGPLFSAEERQAVVAYWAAPGRYLVEPATDTGSVAQLAATTSVPGDPSSRVNVTVAGSVWHRAYMPLIAERRASADPAAAADVRAWEEWVTRRLAYDKAAVGGGTPAPDPGPIPAGLQAALGEPPPLFEWVQPLRYTVRFAPGDSSAPFIYTDNIAFPDRYAFYRSADGVRRYGKQLRSYRGAERQRIEALFDRAGRNTLERNVLLAVSQLEGGFEAVNTYDTGWVSIGFIQFITASDGDGSLAHVLHKHKATDPVDFDRTFRRFGIDVAPERVLVAVDPTTGQELRGREAVQAVIRDKRLTAVFERAGHLDGFRLAQVLVAREQYWPGDDPIVVYVTHLMEQGAADLAPRQIGVYHGGLEASLRVQMAAVREREGRVGDPHYRCWAETRVLRARVADVVRSEAGMATLMDRKVNKGNIRNISTEATAVMARRGLSTLEELAAHERDLVEAMRFRHDFLVDRTLTQPPRR